MIPTSKCKCSIIWLRLRFLVRNASLAQSQKIGASVLVIHTAYLLSSRYETKVLLLQVFLFGENYAYCAVENNFIRTFYNS